MTAAAPWAGIEGFAWDDANARKIWEKHAVHPRECEEVLLGEPRILRDDRHSEAGGEERFAALGATMTGRALAVIFTIRDGRLRVVTARDQSRKERRELGHG